MAMIAFEDSKGRVWRVWSVSPEAMQKRDYLATAYKSGWLCFEADDTGERRRLADVPDRWELLAPERLELLCRVAERVERREPGRSTGITPAEGLTTIGGESTGERSGS